MKNSSNITHTFKYDDMGKTQGTDRIQQTKSDTQFIKNSSGEVIQKVVSTTLTTAYVDADGNIKDNVYESTHSHIYSKEADGSWDRSDPIENHSSVELNQTDSDFQTYVSDVSNFKASEKISPIQEAARINENNSKISRWTSGVLSGLGRGANYIPHPWAKAGGAIISGVGVSVGIIGQMANPTNPESIRVRVNLK